MLLRLSPSAATCPASGRSWSRSIIVLRSEDRPWRVHLLKNRFPASVRRSWREGSSRPRLERPLRCAVLIQKFLLGLGASRNDEPYSMDLRERVVAAVETDGMSRHEGGPVWDRGQFKW